MTFIEWLPGANLANVNPNCQSAFFCARATLDTPIYEVLPAGCDANTSSCTVRVRVPVTMPGLHQEGQIMHPAQIYWFGNTNPTVPCSVPPFGTCNPAPISTCGLFGAGIDEDHGEAMIQVSNVECGNLSGSRFRRYSLSVYRCKGSSACETRRDLAGLDLTEPRLRSVLGCPEPPKQECPLRRNENSCRDCLVSGGGGAPPSGQGGGWGGGPDGGTGPGAELFYTAGGAGHPGWPGTAQWLTTLGRYWSHDYAERIVQDPDDSHVWLITRWATFREFSGLAGGVYGTNSPTDEYRTLRKVGGGWTLTDLDGTVQTFGSGGQWLSTADRFGNAKTATYGTGGELERVDFPDGRAETFTYDAMTGKLATITEVGIDGTTTRTWTYTWTGDDLERIDLPDGRAWEFFYEDTNWPGYLTRVELVGTAGARQVDAAWLYDVAGNVVALWSGDASMTGPDAVDVWQLSFDDPDLPVVTTVTDPLGATSTYTFGRDDGSRKARLESLSGSCPACSIGPNTAVAYNDTNHPLRPTRETDARGVHTDFTYDSNGQVLTRTEASGTALERTTSWTYHPTYPALVTEIEQPSVAGGASTRTTTMTYDASGALTLREISGTEAPGGAFIYPTSYVPTAEGQTASIDPPGYGTADQTSFTYDPARGGLLPISRTDPLVGATAFDYDPFNRRTTVTDSNGVTTTTDYDAADRVTFVTQQGAIPAENLITENRYDELGRLFQTILPRGNVLEYDYDAAGRLLSIERKPDDQPTSHSERTLYQLDAAGNRTREEQQVWDGFGWLTRSLTDFEWLNRCQMQAAVNPNGSRTEYAYDCEGNLE